MRTESKADGQAGATGLTHRLFRLVLRRATQCGSPACLVQDEAQESLWLSSFELKPLPAPEEKLLWGRCATEQLEKGHAMCG